MNPNGHYPIQVIAPDRLIHSEILRGGHMWSKVISRGKTLRFTDLEGGVNVGLLLYNADEKHERYNMPDTLKGQHIFNLTAPYCIHSDMGRIFCSITADTSGWHDTACGTSDARSVLHKFGTRTYQDARNDYYRNGRECFLVELAKWGLGKRDLVPNINLFSKVVSDSEGRLSFDTTHAKAGAAIDLRFEMDTLVIVNTCPHPLDPNLQYAPKPVQLSVFRSDPPTVTDPCRCSRPENERAFTNTEVYNKLRHD
jgi:urea carboxylase-associated protein 2